MHELGIVSGVLDTVRNTVRHERAVRALEVRLRIGDMAQVVSESLDFAWDVLRDEDPRHRRVRTGGGRGASA